MNRKNQNRPAFTPIELLVVIGIITILVGLLLSAIGQTRTAAVRAQTVADIDQLSSAIGSFKATFNVGYLPAMFSLDGGTSPNDSNFYYMRQLFPRITRVPTGTAYHYPSNNLNGNQCMVFFLSGGFVSTFTGFSPNPANPLPGGPVAGASIIGPFMTFPAKRIDYTLGYYLDPWGYPYDYNAYNTTTGNYDGSSPFIDSTGRYEQPRGFQISSGGPDGLLGPGGDYTGANRAAYSGTGYGADDLANFPPTGALRQ